MSEVAWLGVLERSAPAGSVGEPGCAEHFFYRHRGRFNGHGPVLYRHRGIEPTGVSFNSKLARIPVPMRTISSSSATRIRKTITPLVVTGLAFGIAAWVMRDKWSTAPVYACGFVLFSMMFSLLYLWRSGTWRLADSVEEQSDGLRIRRGEKEVLVAYRQIAKVGHRAETGLSVCVLEFHVPTEFGSKIEFLPLTDEESMMQLGIDVWAHLERMVTNAQTETAG